MIGKSKNLRFPGICLFLFFILALYAANPAQAQFFDDGTDQDGLFVDDEDQYFESTGDEYGGGSISQEQDFSDGNTYIDEALLPSVDKSGQMVGERQFQMNITNEKETLPLNIGWGAGTGLLIGGWFALIAEGDNRTTQRDIGVGIVLGIITGALVGTRTIFSPDAPRPGNAQLSDPPSQSYSPLVSLNSGEAQIGVRLSF